jgi:hypothetical protein
MDKLEIIGRIIQIEDTKVLKQIEDLLLSAEALSKEQSAPQKAKTYRIKGENGVVFELADNFASLKIFKSGKHLVAEDRSLRAVTRGYLEMLITNVGRFVKRSEIEKHICVRSESRARRASMMSSVTPRVRARRKPTRPCLYMTSSKASRAGIRNTAFQRIASKS